MWDLRDEDLDDPLHSPDPVPDARMDHSRTPFSAHGWLNVSANAVVVLDLLTPFAGYPIIMYYKNPMPVTPGYNLGGINSSEHSRFAQQAKVDR
ncbi:hypothetical protein SCP_1501910 [Sparassis crispa]|uniref:Uncharacterized protein n=1 Tax=Sparassis crispa TaxID=139825 RepID=A0A401H454_9APHY|nr:hypothetical protein SCP_1501910 [Sparassis crispa]GBE89183.1 hypothetical protein SCP_1501910 [Sparassis crispa]